MPKEEGGKQGKPTTKMTEHSECHTPGAADCPPYRTWQSAPRHGTGGKWWHRVLFGVPEAH